MTPRTQKDLPVQTMDKFLIPRIGVMVTGVALMGVIQMEVMAMGVTRTEVNPPQAIRNDVTGPHGIHSSLDTCGQAEQRLRSVNAGPGVFKRLITRPLHPAGLEPATL
jgi:hypothetical protein